MLEIAILRKYIMMYPKHPYCSFFLWIPVQNYIRRACGVLLKTDLWSTVLFGINTKTIMYYDSTFECLWKVIFSGHVVCFKNWSLVRSAIWNKYQTYYVLWLYNNAYTLTVYRLLSNYYRYCEVINDNIWNLLSQLCVRLIFIYIPDSLRRGINPNSHSSLLNYILKNIISI